MKTLIECIEIHVKKQANKVWTTFMKGTVFTPGLVAAQITSVQPLTGPTGQTFSIKPKYSDGWIKMLNSANYDRAMKGVV